MDSPILASRKELLRKSQNSDGGWGYFAGKQSWFEPTFYAVLALQGEVAADRGWALLKTWQTGSGGWKPNAQVEDPTWVTALGVTLCCVRGEYGTSFQRGVRWLLGSAGVESSFFNRLIRRALGNRAGRDTGNRGWPWRPETSAWVEPTAHSLVALKKAAANFHDRELRERVAEGERLLLTVRSRDGGWNYGSPSALGVDLPSYPETTALALLGLQANAPADVPIAGLSSESRLADAWLALALRACGKPSPFQPSYELPADLMVAALEALACSGGDSPFRAESA